VKLGDAAIFAAGYLLARRAPRRRGAEPRAPTVTHWPTATLIGVPDRTRRPREGLVAEAAIVARLLRLRILTLDATVLFSPARVAGPAPAPTTVRPAAAPPPRCGPGSASARPAPVGRGLTDAVRTLEESAATLAEVQRLGAPANGTSAASADRAA
jgi:hypothetical protein